MTSAMLSDLLKSLGVLGLFLILGFALRAKVKIFQKTFLPASVIGGFLLLALGPIGFKILPIPEDWIKVWSMLPGVVIVPVVTATPLGLNLASKDTGKNLKNIVPLMFIMFATYYLQSAIGFLVNILFSGTGMDLYRTFGWELVIGYTGGHGTAGILGNMLQELNLPYWETAQGVGTTMATFGIVGGILIGMVLINWAARKGYTSILDKPSDIPENIAIGYERDIEKQPSIGRETTKSSSLDTVSLHAAIIFLACFLAYSLLSFFKQLAIPGLKSISVWAYGIIIMFIIWWIIQKLNLSFLIDSKVKGKITGPLTEFAVVAAIASLPLKTVLSYLVPILVMAVLGFVGTTLILVILSKKFLKVDWFEHMIATYGMSTGVFLTGLLLLKVCDPDSKSPALGNYSIAFSVLSAITFALMPLILNMLVNSGVMATFALTSVLTLCGIIGAMISSKLFFKE